MANIGLNVVEVDGKATPSIQPAPTSVAAFLIIAPKGVKDRVEPITNWTEFLEAFGGYMEGAYGAYAVRGFFDNGGARAYVTRLVPDDAESSKVELPDSSNTTALTVKAGERGKENPGVWGDNLSVQVTADTDPAQYSLKVKLGDDVVEIWEHVNHGTAATVINDEILGSNYIMVDESVSALIPAPTTEFKPLTGGSAGSFADEVATASAAKDALSPFDVYEIQLLCCPETSHDNWIVAAKKYCKTTRDDCMFVGHTARDQDPTSTTNYGQTHRAEKEYGAFYFPWIKVANPISKPPGKPIFVPPSGHVMGVYARTERERGIWKAPAGNAAVINGALDVKYHISDVQHTDLVKNASINAIRFIPGQGIVIDSSRTLSTSPLWYYVNVRLLFNFVKSSLKAGLRWTVQEPNDEALWNKVKYNSVTPFLMGLWRRGAFGPGAPEDVFTVKIDAENNRPDDIQSGRLNIEVYFYPSRPAETILITVGQQEGAASASES